MANLLTVGCGGGGAADDGGPVDLGTVPNSEVLALLECPVCLDHITPPIKQCVKGHLVCSDCFPRLNHCPTCRSSMCEERNLAMEQVSRLLRYPCRYYLTGCKEAFTLAKKADHERDCVHLQLKCPFHGQCAFNGSLAEVVPHLAADHGVTPVPVQPAGTFFYRAKNFHRRNVWTLIYSWDRPTNLFRFIIKQVPSSAAAAAAVNNGGGNNVVLGVQQQQHLVAHIQFVGPESAASGYAYQISLFDTERKQTGHEFEGLVTSTLKPIEALPQPGQQSSSKADSDVFVITVAQARNYTDAWDNLNFIVKMKSLVDDVVVAPAAPTRAVASPPPPQAGVGARHRAGDSVPMMETT